MIALLNLRAYTGDMVAPSPNCGTRRADVIEGIVLHATADGGNEARTLAWLRSPRSQASCHLLVSRAGQVIRLVGDQQRAWHAGASRWRGVSDVNSITLGIEIANRNNGEPYTDAQYARVAAVVAHYCRQGLSLDDVVSHGEIAPARRTDPLGWDWDRLRAMVELQLLPAQATPPAAPLTPEPGGVLASIAPPMQRVRASSPPKPALCSRTLWVNGLTVLTAGAVIAGESLELAFRVGLSVPEEITMWALFAVGVVNILLRFRTTRPLRCTQGVQRVEPEDPIAPYQVRVLTKQKRSRRFEAA